MIDFTNYCFHHTLVGDGVPTEGLGAALLPLASSSSGSTTGIIYTKQTVKKAPWLDRLCVIKSREPSGIQTLITGATS